MAARTEQRRFGTFDLTNATNKVSVERWSNQVLHKATFKDRLKGDGSIPLRDILRGHQVDIAGKVTGVDSGDVSTRLDNLIAALANGEDWLSLYDDRRLRCRLDGNLKYAMVPGSGGMVYTWSAKMRSRWPFWEGTSVTSETFAGLTGIGPHILTLAASVGGVAPTFPTLLVTNSGTAFSNKVLTFTNTSTVEQMQLVGMDMSNNHQASIDMREGHLGDGVSTSLTPVAIDGQWFALSAGAVPVLEFAHNVGSGGSFAVQVSYTPQFWTP